MLFESEKFLGCGNPMQKVLAGAIRGYLDAGGKDIPFPTSKQSLILEQATREYKNEPTNPEHLTQFTGAFWAEAGRKIKKDYVVSEFPLSAHEIKEKQEKGYMPVFVPAEVSRVDLGKMFPKMGSWAVQEGNSAVDVVNNSGWLWIEASIDAPNLNTTQIQLKEKFRKERKQGQSLRSYIIGGQISKLLTDKYFDQGPTWSRLLGSCDGGGVLSADFDSDGYLDVNSGWVPEVCDGSLGGRFEEVIKA
jgi:hypothetical protein